jgi:hypothetical protein
LNGVRTRGLIGIETEACTRLDWGTGLDGLGEAGAGAGWGSDWDLTKASHAAWDDEQKHLSPLAFRARRVLRDDGSRASASTKAMSSALLGSALLHWLAHPTAGETTIGRPATVMSADTMLKVSL